MYVNWPSQRPFHSLCINRKEKLLQLSTRCVSDTCTCTQAGTGPGFSRAWAGSDWTPEAEGSLRHHTVSPLPTGHTTFQGRFIPSPRPSNTSAEEQEGSRPFFIFSFFSLSPTDALSVQNSACVCACVRTHIAPFPRGQWSRSFSIYRICTSQSIFKYIILETTHKTFI